LPKLHKTPLFRVLILSMDILYTRIKRNANKKAKFLLLSENKYYLFIV